MAYVRPVHVLYNDNIMNAVHFTIMHACMYLVPIMCHMHDFFCPVVLCILSVHIPCRECANG